MSHGDKLLQRCIQSHHNHKVRPPKITKSSVKSNNEAEICRLVQTKLNLIQKLSGIHVFIMRKVNNRFM